jgi:hypothetical protein
VIRNPVQRPATPPIIEASVWAQIAHMSNVSRNRLLGENRQGLKRVIQPKSSVKRLSVSGLDGQPVAHGRRKIIKLPVYRNFPEFSFDEAGTPFVLNWRP